MPSVVLPLPIWHEKTHWVEAGSSFKDSSMMSKQLSAGAPSSTTGTRMQLTWRDTCRGEVVLARKYAGIVLTLLGNTVSTSQTLIFFIEFWFSPVKGEPGLPISGTTKTSGFSTNAQSTFASVVFYTVSGTSAPNTAHLSVSLNLCSSWNNALAADEGVAVRNERE